MPPVRTYVVPWPPSLNTMYPTRDGRRRLSGKAAKWKRHALEELGLQRAQRVAGPAKVMIALHPNSKRLFDLDNKVKAILDLLKTAGVVEDDNWRHVPSIAVALGETLPTAKAVLTVSTHLEPPIADTTLGIYPPSE